MANSEQRIRKYVADEKRKGTASAKIIVGITKLDGQTGKDAQKMVKSLQDAGLSPTQELGKYFGLSTKPVDPKAKTKNKNATLGDKAKSTNYSAMSGVAKSFGKVAQVANSGLDAVSGGINKALGTKIPTGNRAAYDRDVAAMDARKDQLRDQANYSGMDLGELTGDIAAKAPLYVAGGAPSAGVKGLAAFAGREAVIGGLDGSLRYAKSTDEQVGNTLVGAAGGAVFGPVGVGVGKTVGSVIQRGSRVAANRSGRTATAATKLVDDAITETGIKVNQATRNRLVNDATKNLSKSKQIDAAAAVRKSLLEDNGFKGTSAQISRNPSEWRAERELAKIDGNPIKEAHVANNEQLTSKWESLVDETGTRPIDNTARMESTFQTLNDGDANTRATINKLYDDAKALSGGDIEINHARFIDDMTEHLTYNIDEAYVPKVRNLIEGVVKQDGRLTLKGVESIKKRMNTLIGSTSDGSYRYALNEAKRMLDDEVIKSGDDFIQAAANNPSLAGRKAELDLAAEGFAKARGAARDRFQDLDSNPALRAALDDASPDKGFSKLVLNSDTRDLIKLVDGLKDTPQGKQNLADLQGATIEHFIKKATMADSGAFNTAKLNKAIDDFTPEKMRALFTPEQIARINDVQKVGNILMRQPLGSPVNHAGTSSSLINALIGIAGGLGRIPFGGGHLANIATGGVSTVVDMSKKGAATTATARALSGQPAITRGSSLGLTDEQLRLLGMMPAAGQAGAATGANLGN